MMKTVTRAAECGQKLQLIVPGDYPCVRRFRYRRLLTFLWLQGYGSTFVAMLKQTNAFFCVFYLVRLVSQGMWIQALDYIFPRFLPLEPCSTPSLEASVLVKFLRVHHLFQSEVTSKISRDWRPMWAKAAKIVGDLANMTPEFKDRKLLPDGPMGPPNVLPIGFGFAPFRRRRHVKDHTRPISKHAHGKHTRRIANIYFDKRMSLPSSSHCSRELSPEILAKARDEWFGRIFDECIKAATCLKINQGCALQSSAQEGTPVTGNVINSGCSSVPLTTGAGSTISQTMLGIIACPAKNSEVISTTNAGTGQETCCTASARQGSHPRKRPMTEQTENYLSTKNNSLVVPMVTQAQIKKFVLLRVLVRVLFQERDA